MGHRLDLSTFARASRANRSYCSDPRRFDHDGVDGDDWTAYGKVEIMGSFSIWHWIIVLVVLPLTFVPSIVAFRRNHSQKWLIVILQFLTLIGWVIALIWAVSGKTDNLSGNAGEVFK